MCGGGQDRLVFGALPFDLVRAALDEQFDAREGGALTRDDEWGFGVVGSAVNDAIDEPRGALPVAAVARECCAFHPLCLRFTINSPEIGECSSTEKDAAER
jgi:hypothetical protein